MVIPSNVFICELPICDIGESFKDWFICSWDLEYKDDHSIMPFFISFYSCVEHEEKTLNFWSKNLRLDAIYKQKLMDINEVSM